MSKDTGSTLESLFEELGELHEVRILAEKKAFVRIAERQMRKHRISRSEFARRMRSSRTQVDRLLDRDNVGLTFATLERAVHALGMDFEIRFFEKPTNSSAGRNRHPSARRLGTAPPRRVASRAGSPV